MATAGTAGRIAFLAYGASTASMAEVGEVRDFDLGFTHTPIDATSNDSSGYEESIKGNQGWTLTFGSIHARAEAEQISIRKMPSTSGAKYFQLRPSTAQSQKWVGLGWLTNYSVRGAHDAVVLFNGSIKFTGAVTLST